ncbi:MAG TPA: hypothetical protein VK209_08160 [Candidatus Sulfotelmatobacter sp.]|nr:hypothetical protein [Candidatus Sulfotelmatobacter sp.]
MAEETLDWIFVNNVPMLADKTRIAKQQKIETWLNLHHILKELGLDKGIAELTAPIRFVV